MHRGSNLLVNPGSLMRSTASQKDYKPVIHVLYDDLSVEQIPVPLKSEIDDKHLIKEEERDERMESFISSLNTDVEITFNFKNNLTQLIEENSISKSVKDLINEIMEERC
jgi:hypothetical protein